MVKTFPNIHRKRNEPEDSKPIIIKDSLLSSSSPFVCNPMIPCNTEDLLKLPVMIINKNSDKDRYTYAYENIKQAGFTNIQRFSAIDTRQENYIDFYSLKVCSKDPIYQHRGKQGCFLSHYLLWKHMVIHKIPALIIFEDDVYFHPKWEELIEDLYSKTPKNFDFLYLGTSFLLFHSEGLIEKGPVYNTHAMLMTLEGAKKLIQFTQTLPIKTLDVFLAEIEKQYFTELNWYVWDISYLPNTDKTYDKNFNGLVYQSQEFPSNCSCLKS